MMYDTKRVIALKSELEPYTSSPQAAMQIATALERYNIHTLEEAAAYGDAWLLKVRGIGKLNLETIRTAWKCKHDSVLHREFMLTKMRSLKFSIENEIEALVGRLDLINKEIAKLVGEE